MRTRFAIPLGLGLVACQATEVWPPPPLEGGGGVVMLITREGTPERAYAVEGGEPLPSFVHRQSGEEVVYAWLYEEKLSALGLVVGEIELSQPATTPAPEPQRAFELRAPYARWSETTATDLFERLPLQRRPDFCDPALGFVRTDYDIERSRAAGPFFTENRRLGSMLVGNQAGVWEVSGGGPQAVIGPASTSTLAPPDVATHPFVSAHWDRTDQGRHFFYQLDGRLWETTLHTPFEVVGTNPGAHDSRYAWIAGNDEFFDFEIFVLDDHGAIWRFDEMGWTSIREPIEPEDLGSEGGLVWIAPNDVMMIGVGGRILRIRDGRSVDVTPDGMARATMLLNELFVGVFLGDSDGQLWRSVGGGWIKLATSRDGPILTLGAHSGGYLYGGTGGILHYYREGQPDCSGTVTAPSTIFRVTGLYQGETVLMSSPAFLGDPAPIHITALNPIQR